MLLITYRMPNITRGPKRAMTLTQTFLPCNPNHLVVDQSLSFLTFPLYSNVDSGRCWFIVVQNWRIVLRLQDDICPSVVIICSDSWMFFLLLWASLSLFHSPRHNSRRRSLLMLVLSHSDTHYLNRHMVGCGYHEILIPCSTTVLFSTTLLLIFISRVDEGKWILCSVDRNKFLRYIGMKTVDMSLDVSLP